MGRARIPPFPMPDPRAVPRPPFTRDGRILPGTWVPTLHPDRDACTEQDFFAAHRLQPISWLTDPPRVQTSVPSLQQRPGSGSTWTEVQVVMTLVSYMVLLSLMSSGKAGLFSVFGGGVTGGEGFLGEMFTSVPLPKAWMAFPGTGDVYGGLHPGGDGAG